MKNRTKISCSMALCLAVNLIAVVQVAIADSPPQKSDLNTHTPSPTAFTYQGQLRDASGPVNGLFDVRVTLYPTQTDPSALQSIEREGLSLANGLFRLSLDFGSAIWETNEGWLEMAVRAHGDDSYTVLTPRQKLTSTPYAILAQAEPWSLIGVPVGVVDRMAIETEDPCPMPHDSGPSHPDGQQSAICDPQSAIEAAALQRTPNFIAKFDGSGNSTVNSIMYDNGTNVGIGTTSPSFKLHVNGVEEGISIQGPSATASNLAYMTFRNSAGTRIGYVGDGSTGDNNVFLASDTGDVSLITLAGRVLTATSSGNVGIGTANPLRALQLGPSPDAAFTIEPSDASPNAGFIRFGDRTGWKLHFGRSRESSLLNGAPLNTGTTGVLMTLQDNGNVGLGTATPQAKPDVRGNIRLGASGQFEVIESTNGGAAIANNLYIRQFTELASPAHLCWRASNVGVQALAITNCTSSSSSLRYKNHVQPFSGGLDVINRLQPVTFTWKDGGQRDFGLSAEEVAEVEPLLVTRNEKGDVEDVKSDNLSILFINAFKEQQGQIKTQQQQIDALKQQIDALKKWVCQANPQADVCKD